MLALEIEWLMGVCWAAREPAHEAPDWPPQPDRVFSALVASWSARGERADERVALEWLERQEPPVLHAAEGEARTTVTVYVPVNDAAAPSTDSPSWLVKLEAGKPLGNPEIKERTKHLGAADPAWRSRQARTFAASTLPQDGKAHLRLVWNVAPTAPQLDALQALARDTSYVGHSSAVVRCRFESPAAADPRGALLQRPTRGAPYAGRLAELEALYRRHTEQADERARPRPSQRPGPAPELFHAPSSVFGAGWIILEHARGERPDPRAAATLARRLRDALMSAYGDPIPEWLSGHAADRTPTRQSHLAILPLAGVGWDHPDGRLHGLGLALPREKEAAWANPTPVDFEDRARLDAAIDRLADAGDDGVITLHLGKAGDWRLRRTGAPSLESLKPDRYCRTSSRWNTATPIALDRHPKADKLGERAAEAAGIIADACLNIGLPAPVDVRVHKHAAVAGAPSAWPAGGSPAWLNWARPKSLEGRPLTHATLTFAEPVRGPVILGAGRFFGLGLCLPLSDGEDAPVRDAP